MATDYQTLITEAGGYNCLLPGQWELIKLGLLKQILLAQNPMADTSQGALLEAAGCYQCLTPGLDKLLELALLKQIAEGGGVGGTGGLSHGTDVPAADPGTETALYVKDDTSNLYYWYDAIGQWVQLL